jgi:hypothetical protein
MVCSLRPSDLRVVLPHETCEKSQLTLTTVTNAACVRLFGGGGERMLTRLMVNSLDHIILD